MDPLRALIREVPDFPRKGIRFYDITPLLGDATGYHRLLEALASRWAGHRVDRVVGIEARGFIFGAPLADRLGAGFVPVRKPGKLPAATAHKTYALEYGEDTLHVHRDAFTPGQRVLIADDLLATGGTAAACVALARSLGAEVVGAAFAIELAGLNGRAKLEGVEVDAVLRY